MGDVLTSRLGSGDVGTLKPFWVSDGGVVVALVKA